MQAKTETQILGMKNDFSFGVEVEMVGITRSRAAQLAADFLGGGYDETAFEDGYATWSAWDTEGRKWKFSKDASLRAACEEESCELVSPVLEYQDIELLQELIRKLRAAGAVSDPNHGCGVHIHVSRKGENFTAPQIRNIVNIMASHEAQIGRAIRIDQDRTHTYCRLIDPRFLDRVNRVRPQSLETLENIWYVSQDEDRGRTQHYNHSRYHMLNLHSFFHGHGTVEFRLFQFANPHDGRRGGLHAGELKAYIQLCLGICELATLIKTASPTPQQTENEKYAFRCWLLRLGFIGDEFATARKLLLQNLDGDSAWRHTSR